MPSIYKFCGMLQELEIFLLNDQPTSCPYCGARVDFYDFYYGNEFFQFNICLRDNCAYVFATMED